jgi:UDP-N-acetyl-D-mannosaminuronic acid dehydrogenase
MNINNSFSKVCILGLGYIGLPTAALLANRGHHVIGVDIQQSVVNTINKGNIHIVEPELDTFVKAAIHSKFLRATVQPTQADVFIIAVPTPFCENNKPNLNFVFEAVQSIAPYIKPGNLVILESTSPIGTTEKIAQILIEDGIDIEGVHIAYCPERVLPGHVMRELIENDRIVGGLTKASTQKAVSFYQSFVSGEVIATNARTAELCKLAENSYRDTNIAFANELSMICDEANIDIWELRALANRHPRVEILQPGCGVGGHCIAVDPWFIVAEYPKHSALIRKAREVNTYKSEWVVEKIKNKALMFELQVGRKPKIAMLGLAFKPNIDDLRESPALSIARIIDAQFPHQVLFVEPNIKTHPDFFISPLEKTLEIADFFVILVAHTEFRGMFDITENEDVLDFCGITAKIH